jgi:3-methyladenine DNA glycosylase AlkC
MLEQWAEDENCLARRLASEGTRPRLPLAPRLPQFIKDPRPVLKLLDKLKADPTLLVRRSVANNLNDIAKDNPDVVVEILRAWQKSRDKDTQWLINHASRTLIKQGHREALALLGYPPNPAITVQNLRLGSSAVNLGEVLCFSFEIESVANESQNLMIDYVIHHMKANGKLAPKVFKLTSKKLKAGETVRLSKKHSFKLINTRVYYPGWHKVGVQVNGQVLAEADFELRS